MRRVTQKDIAKRVGVHLSTVSLVFKDSPRISENTKNKVLEVAKEMGYQPDPNLAALAYYRSHKSNEGKAFQKVAFLTTHKFKTDRREGFSVRDMFEGAKVRANELGYDVEHFWVREPKMTVERLSTILYSRGIKGVILGSIIGSLEGWSLDWDQFSVVKINRNPKILSFNMVRPDHLQMVRLAMRKLVEKGFTNIGLCVPESWSIHLDEAFELGYSWESLKSGGKVPYLTCPRDGATIFKKWYERHQPDVLLACSGEVIPWLEEMGLQIGTDVKYADLNVFPNMNWSGIHEDHKLVGMTAVDVLHSLLVRNAYGEADTYLTTTVPGVWRDGDTL